MTKQTIDLDAARKNAALAVGKLAAIRADLNAQVLDQPEMIDALLCAFASGEHALIVGPQGEAKSHAARTAASYFPGSTFMRLLSRFSTPDEILGTFDPKALIDEGRMSRNMSDMAPDCETVVLDEVAKCNSPCLNALLALLNGEPVDGQTPKTKTAIGLSNEHFRGIDSLARKGDDESLLPLYDRFGLRVVIGKPTSEDTLRRIMVGNFAAPTADPLTADEFDAIRTLVDALWRSLDSSVIDSILDVNDTLDAQGIKTSSRRLRKAARIVAAHAVVSGRMNVSRTDVKVLRFVLWSNPADIEAVAAAVIDAGDTHVATALHIEAEVMAAFDEFKNADESTFADVSARAVAREQLMIRIKSELDVLAGLVDDSADPDEIRRVIAQVKQVGLALKKDAMAALGFLD